MQLVEVKRMQAVLAVVWLIALAVILLAGCQAFSLSIAMPVDIPATLRDIASGIPGLWPNELYIFT